MWETKRLNAVQEIAANVKMERLYRHNGKGSQIIGLLCTQNGRQSRRLKGTVYTASVTYDNMAPVAIHSVWRQTGGVMARQGYHHNIPCGATAPLGSSCRMGVPERGSGWKESGIYCLSQLTNVQFALEIKLQIELQWTLYYH
jgi:hypothetical protein